MLKALALPAALALAGSAEAHDYSADIICRVTETDDQRSAWSFAPNTIGADGSPVSTFVETSYLRHGQSVVSQAGSRPVWLMTANPVGGVTLLPRNNPGWALVVSNVARAGTTISGGYASLLRNGIVRLRHGAEFGLQIGLRRLAYPFRLFELPNLAEGDGAALDIAVAAMSSAAALVDEDPDTVLGTQLLQSRELRSNFPLVFKADKDIGINEELAAAHSLRAHVCVATHTDTIRAAQIQSACAAQSVRSVVQAGKLSRG
jgi:hypothetical protein